MNRAIRHSEFFSPTPSATKSRPAAPVMARAIVALIAGDRSVSSAIDFATANGDDELVRALSTSTGATGGFAVPQGYSDDIVESLKPLVAVRKLNPVTVPMPHGNFYLPRITASGTAAYIAENSVIGQTQQSFGGLALNSRKLAALVPISNSLVRSSRPAAEQIATNDLVSIMAATEDASFILGGGTEYTPRGLRNWCLPANVIPFSGTADAPTIDGALLQLEQALMLANVRMLRPGWILSPRTATYLESLRNATTWQRAYPEMLERGVLRGKPYAVSTNVPVNLSGTQSEIYLADFADVIIAENPYIVDTSTNGFWVDGSGNKVSAYTSDQTIVRVLATHDLGMRHQESVAVLTAVTF